MSIAEVSAIHENPRKQMTLESEKGLLAALMCDNRYFDKVAALVEVDDFADPIHQRIYSGIATLIGSGEKANPLTLQRYVECDDDVTTPEEVRSYLIHLLANVITTVNAPHYARYVQDSSIRRRLIAEAEGARHDAMHSEDSGRDIASRAAACMEALAGDREQNTATFPEAVAAAVTAEQQAFDTGGRSAGVPTGLPSLDRLTGGLPTSEITILGARTGVGKTALAGTIAKNAALAGNHVLFFSLEMTMAQLATRLIVGDAKIDGSAALRGRLAEQDRRDFAAAAQRVSNLPITIDHSSNIDCDAICARAKAAWRAKKCDLLIIDYLGLIRSGDRYRGNRVYEIEEVTRALKGLANFCEIPILLLHQISRAVEQRDDKRPTLADLRDCLPGDALVMNADTGERVPVSKIVSANLRFNVWAVGDDYRLRKQPVIDAWSVGKQMVHVVTTRTGRRVRCTGGHRFLTGTGWRRLDEIKVGAEIAVPRGYGEPVLCRPISEGRALLLGWLIGDGYLGGTATLTVAGETEATIAADLARLEFGIKPSIKPEHKNTAALKVVMTTGSMTGAKKNPLTRWLREIGAWEKTGVDKRAPPVVFAQPGPVIRAFLRGLYQADGTCTKPRVGSRVTIKLCTISEGLARDVQHLLLRVGIASSVRRDNHRASGFRTRDRWIWTVTLGDRKTTARFLDEIGFIGRKHDKAMGKLEREKQNDAAHLDRLPRAVNNHIDRRRADEELSHRVVGWRQQGKRMSRATAAAVAERIEDPWLASLAISDVTWDEITAVQECGVESVYDLTVRDLSNFCVDDFITHNSGALEQDAGMVLLIYRHEYYISRKEPDGTNIEKLADWTEEMRKCRGVAEITVAKMRSGPSNVTKIVDFDAASGRFFEASEDGAPDQTFAGW